ncbi:hypothetical protein ACIPSE_15680 [Streptomyces sp. NPDC090106]|uniref:hypothetical protein n=1 Tax=Streptomyces sp. NPDC090106 TaxID=3365946 RepID=UPI0038181D04
MTRRLRTVRATGLLVALLSLGAGTPPAAAAGDPSPGVHAPRAEPSRAGSRAGEGRERPGRREPVPDPEAAAPRTATPSGVPEPVRTPVPPPSPVAQQAVTPDTQPTGPVLRVLPLGSGLVLIGLGLGTALLGWRLRRG